MTGDRWISDNYEFGEILGEGAFGAVYRARQVSTARDVAVKFYRPELVRGGREVRIHCQLPSHPNLVTVYDAGETEAGPFGAGPYMVMEYLEGGSIWDWVERKGKPFSLRGIQAVGIQLSNALAFVHSQGIIHRDIKPQNILLCKSSGKCKLGDFGIACDLNTMVTATRTASSPGSVAFMAPEVAAGKTMGDERSDLYSFGAVLYWLCTRELPLGRFKDPNQTNPDIPEALNDLIMKLLEPDANERVQTADNTAALLKEGLQRQSAAAKPARKPPPVVDTETVPPVAAPDSPTSRSEEERKRKHTIPGKAILATLGILLAGLVLGSVIHPSIAWAVLLGTSIWAGVDASTIELSKYKLRGPSSPAVTVIGCLVFWPIVFPWYLMNKGRIARGAARLKGESQGQGSQEAKQATAAQPQRESLGQTGKAGHAEEKEEPDGKSESCEAEELSGDQDSHDEHAGIPWYRRSSTHLRLLGGPLLMWIGSGILGSTLKSNLLLQVSMYSLVLVPCSLLLSSVVLMTGGVYWPQVNGAGGLRKWHPASRANLLVMLVVAMLVLVVGLQSCTAQRAEIFFSRGNEAFEHADYYEALRQYDKALAITPRLAEAWYNKGLCYLRLERYGEAKKALQRAVEVAPGIRKNIPALVDFTWLLEIDGRIDESIEQGRIGLLQSARMDLERLGGEGVHPDAKELYQVLLDRAHDVEKLEDDYGVITKRDRIHYTFEPGQDGVHHSSVSREIRIAALMQSTWLFAYEANGASWRLAKFPRYRQIGKYAITIASASVSDAAARGEEGGLEGTVDPQVVVCHGDDGGYWPMAETGHGSGRRNVAFERRSFELYYPEGATLYLAVIDVDETSGEVLDMVAVPKQDYSGKLRCEHGSEVEVEVKYEAL